MRQVCQLGKLLREAGFRPIPASSGAYIVSDGETQHPALIRLLGNGSAHWVSILVSVGKPVPRAARLWDLLRLSLEMDLWKVCLIDLEELALAIDLPPEQASPIVLRATVTLGRELAAVASKGVTGAGFHEIVCRTHQAYQTGGSDGTLEWLVAAEIANWEVKESVGNNAHLRLGGSDVFVRQLGSLYAAYTFTDLYLPRTDWLFLLALNRTLDGCKIGFSQSGELVLAAEIHTPADEVCLIHLVHGLMLACKRVIPVARYLAAENGVAGTSFWSSWRRRILGW
ncbi:MAG: hypothetical protein NZ899_14530 [Thermoguttaceae bacterium]|nr:hypothetical protein [Thermoguttaceae bacterium]